MIVVTGATGNLGSRVIKELLERTAPERIVATTRDPARAAALVQAGVEVRHGDFAAPDSLAAAFAGADQVLIVSSDAERFGGDAVAHHRSAIGAARAAGARRILYTSHMGASATSAFVPMHTHAATEVILREAGIAWTALRNGFYAETVPSLIVRDAASTGLLSAPADGPVAWTTRDDLAAAAAAILTDEGRFDGPTPPLTASEAPTLDDAAAMLSELHGRCVVRQVAADDAFEADLAFQGMPKPVVAITLGMYRAARAGEFAAVSPALGDLIGREPQSLRDVLAPPSR
ncbi:NAD(P)H-binding protein [Sphingomonas aracearum]|uniref:NAD-dependent epimerase/dehydratase family protein n=1 Tax=Sphingomonas aracearum TaxID=2283317 RepID=A0A369W1Y5_9SPHN|nr:NAD(P)H-binding protein [Sphingomonas aracearum]RDE07370.1 NAD-dependent epimerase/dehydratase family protein [Sphingomonas aracearum]